MPEMSIAEKGAALIALSTALLLGTPQAEADEVPVTIIKPTINSPKAGGPACPGATCWSAMMPPVAAGKTPGVDQHAFDTAFVGFTNWNLSNTLRIYTSDQVDSMLGALRKEYEKQEKEFEQKIINELDARLPKATVSPSK
jgi:hypothetical protein